MSQAQKESRPAAARLISQKELSSDDDEGFDAINKLLQNPEPVKLDNECTKKMQKRKTKLQCKTKAKLKKLKIPMKNRFMEGEEVGQQLPPSSETSGSKQIYPQIPTKVLNRFNESKARGQALLASEGGHQPEDLYRNQLSNSMFKSEKDCQEKDHY